QGVRLGNARDRLAHLDSLALELDLVEDGPFASRGADDPPLQVERSAAEGVVAADQELALGEGRVPEVVVPPIEEHGQLVVAVYRHPCLAAGHALVLGPRRTDPDDSGSTSLQREGRPPMTFSSFRMLKEPAPFCSIAEPPLMNLSGLPVMTCPLRLPLSPVKGEFRVSLSRGNSPAKSLLAVNADGFRALPTKLSSV